MLPAPNLRPPYLFIRYFFFATFLDLARPETCGASSAADPVDRLVDRFVHRDVDVSHPSLDDDSLCCCCPCRLYERAVCPGIHWNDLDVGEFLRVRFNK